MLLPLEAAPTCEVATESPHTQRPVSWSPAPRMECSCRELSSRALGLIGALQATLPVRAATPCSRGTWVTCVAEDFPVL